VAYGMALGYADPDAPDTVSRPTASFNAGSSFWIRSHTRTVSMFQ
jgi:hypothetical protein